MAMHQHLGVLITRSDYGMLRQDKKLNRIIFRSLQQYYETPLLPNLQHFKHKELQFSKENSSIIKALIYYHYKNPKGEVFWKTNSTQTQCRLDLFQPLFQQYENQNYSIFL